MLMEHDRQKYNVIREWIIFALSIGLGAHIILGLMLHSPESWPLKSLWIYGLLISFCVYIVVQLCRSLWWFLRGNSQSQGSEPSED